MRIYLFKGKHPMYETLVACPPAGVEYFPQAHHDGREEYNLYGPLGSLMRSVVDGGFKAVDIPRVAPIFGRYDLVHSCRGFLVIGGNNFVVDFEHVSSFAGMRHTRMRSHRLRERIEKGLRSQRCKRLLPHSQAALDTLALLPSGKELSKKSTILYPTVLVPGVPSRRSPRSGPPKILFFGEYYWKGGREVIRACERLSGRLDFALDYISLGVHPPKDVIKRAKTKFKLDYHEGAIPRAELFEEKYPATDIFAMPSCLDTLGYAFLEAMAHGIPCVGTKHFATPEIVDDGRSGILIDPPARFFDSGGVGHPEVQIEAVNTENAVADISIALEKLISSDSLRSSMGDEGRRAVTEGRFSVATRNTILKEVYEESLRR